MKRAYFYYISLNLDIDSALCQEQNRVILNGGENYMYSIISTDEQGCIIEFNSAAEETFGWSRSKVLGKKLAQIIISPLLREGFERDLRHDLETGKHSILDRRIEIDAIHRNGTIFPVELGITAVRVDHRRVLNAYVRDVAVLRQAEEKIRDLAKFPDENPNPILRVDKDGILLYSNNPGQILVEAW